MSEGLNNKQQAFVEQYLTCWNASEAARRAGYNGKANVVGPRLLANVSIQAIIQTRLVEMKMGADEVLARLSDQSRASVAPFLRTDEQGNPTGFNLGPDRPTHLVKKVAITDKGISFEVYDAQAALALMAKHHGLLVDRTEISGPDNGPIEIADARNKLATILSRALTDRNAGGAGERDSAAPVDDSSRTAE